MTEDDLVERLTNLKQARGAGSRAGQKAPHKPLLLLAALSLLEQSGRNRFDFAPLRERFDPLWDRYGWTSASGGKAAYPFWYLTSDGIWTLAKATGPVATSGSPPPALGVLEREGYFGQFSPGAWALLSRPKVRHRAVDLLIATHFRESVREELRDDLGATWAPWQPVPSEVAAPARRRDPAMQARFRKEVIEAYEGRCAVCGFCPRDARPPSAIAAAHIWPFEEDGPFDVRNGVALCPIHHWALDAYAMAFDDELRVLVSSRVKDGQMIDFFLRRHSGEPLRRPLFPEKTPDLAFVRLQREKRFLGAPLPFAVKDLP